MYHMDQNYILWIGQPRKKVWSFSLAQPVSPQGIQNDEEERDSEMASQSLSQLLSQQGFLQFDNRDHP